MDENDIEIREILEFSDFDINEIKARLEGFSEEDLWVYYQI